MTGDPATAVTRYWMEKAQEALASARDEVRAGRHAFAVNRAYYAAFYAASAVLLALGERFVKHTGVRGAVHRRLVGSSVLSIELGRAYDRLFQDRQEADYVELTTFSDEEALECIEQAAALVARLNQVLSSIPPPSGDASHKPA
jgi:uncharacterized protein (UPF0332 family)